MTRKECQYCPSVEEVAPCLENHHHVPRYRRPYAEGDHRLGSFHHEDQDHRSSREEILRLDRWLHLGLSFHLPRNVDLQARIRRVRPRHCPQKMLIKISRTLRQQRQQLHFRQQITNLGNSSFFFLNTRVSFLLISLWYLTHAFF